MNDICIFESSYLSPSHSYTSHLHVMSGVQIV